MLVFLAAFVALASANCPLGTVYHQEFNRCYKFDSTAQPFYLAEEACISIGGHVVSISNGYENAMLSETAPSAEIATFSPSDSHIELEHVGAGAVTRSPPVNYTNWATGQPADGTTCAVQNSKDGTWTSVSCNSAYAYVCAVTASFPAPTCPPCPTPAGVLSNYVHPSSATAIPDGLISTRLDLSNATDTSFSLPSTMLRLFVCQKEGTLHQFTAKRRTYLLPTSPKPEWNTRKRMI
ncbi:lectin C-type domain protein [Cooperia oncophora]